METKFKKTQLDMMVTLCAERFAGRFDKAGMPYMFHLFEVARNVKKITHRQDDELMAIAFGHDLIEDTKTSFSELEKMGFTSRVIDGIDRLTKHTGQSYEEYQEKVLGSYDSAIVKMADIMHNSDLTRLKGITEKDLERAKEYHKFYMKLGGVVYGM